MYFGNTDTFFVEIAVFQVLE